MLGAQKHGLSLVHLDVLPSLQVWIIAGMHAPASLAAQPSSESMKVYGGTSTGWRARGCYVFNAGPMHDLHSDLADGPVLSKDVIQLL